MGASQSHKNSDCSKSDYEKIIHAYKLKDAICKEDFLRILSVCDKSISKSIWDYTVGKSSYCLESQFDEVIDQCRFRTGQRWLMYLFSICKVNESLTSDHLRMIIDWLSFSCDEIYVIISKSFPGINNDDFDVSEFLTWIDRNLPEFGIDLSRYIHRTLTCQSSFCGDIKSELTSIANNLQSELISPHVIILLCASLPMSYKISEKAEEFLFMNLKMWNLLYSSDTHGLSASKLKEKSFDYDGNIIMLIRCDSGLFCLASDTGLKEDWNVYGGVDARFLQLEPFYKKHISGSRSESTKNKSGIIYSHFTAKTGRRGIFIGHNPLSNPVVGIDEDLSNMTVLGHVEPIRVIEVFAVGYGVDEKMAKLRDIRHWESKEVTKHKNRKLKAEDWADNPDREILDMGGVNVRNADMVGGIDRDLELHN